jgi:hypothetical protein
MSCTSISAGTTISAARINKPLCKAASRPTCSATTTEAIAALRLRRGAWRGECKARECVERETVITKEDYQKPMRRKHRLSACSAEVDADVQRLKIHHAAATTSSRLPASAVIRAVTEKERVSMNDLAGWAWLARCWPSGNGRCTGPPPHERRSRTGRTG